MTTKGNTSVSIKNWVVRLARTHVGQQFRATSIGRRTEAAARAAYHAGPPRARSQNTTLLTDRLWRLHQLPIDESAVLYQASDGAGMLDNPLAIFTFLLEHPGYAQLRHIWVISGDEALDAATAGWKHHPRVSFVRYRSDDYYKALVTSKYLINNTSFGTEFAKRPDQVYVNTWHGVPLKRMGYDMPSGYIETRNVLRNFVAADYLVSAGEYMTDTMYRRAYRLDGIFEGRVLEVGQPRIDQQTATDRFTAREALRRAGCRFDDEKIVLFAPTWRGSSFRSPDHDVDELLSVHQALTRASVASGYRVLLKVHGFVARAIGDDPRLRDFLVPDSVPANDVLAATDMLVTDYSSIFFDYLALDRPIAFYVPDIDDYERDRGLYIGSAQWPGPVARTLDLLAVEVATIALGHDSHTGARQEWRDRFGPHDDGHATERLVDIVFGHGRSPSPCEIRLRSDRTKILIYGGGVLRNGITTAMLGLLQLIDHSVYDVSILYDYKNTRIFRQQVQKIHPAVRHFPRIGAMIQQVGDSRGRDLIRTDGLDAPPAVLERQRSNFDREWRRCFGDVHFDHVIDYSGYSSFWPFLLMADRAAVKSIWVHSDLVREVEMSKAGSRPQAQSLPGVFATYRGFDNVVAVTDPLLEITRRNFQHLAPSSTFACVNNVLDVDGLFRAAGAADPERPTDAGAPGNPMPVASPDAAVEFAARSFGWDEVSRAVTRFRVRRSLLPADPGTTVFITAGRLSPEKNHERLIRAFALVHHRLPHTYLLICGDGILRHRLEALIRTLGLSAACRLAGHVEQVPALVAKADCFVFSSDYEGQGLAVLEAVALRIPVVTTRFDAVYSVLPPGAGKVVDPTVDDLAEGMVDFLQGKVPAAPFSAREYNERAMADFVKVIHAPS